MDTVGATGRRRQIFDALWAAMCAHEHGSPMARLFSAEIARMCDHDGITDGLVRWCMNLGHQVDHDVARAILERDGAAPAWREEDRRAYPAA